VIDVRALQSERCGHFESGLRSHSLVVKNSEIVAVSFCQAQVVYFDGRGLCGVNATHVDHEFSVDVNPHVIVTDKLEDFASVVLEYAHEHHSVGEISVPFPAVIFHKVSKTKSIYGEESLEISLEDSVTAWGECGVAPRVELCECDVLWYIYGVPGGSSIGPQVVVKCVKGVRILHCGVLACQVQCGEPVGTEYSVDQTSVISSDILKIGVASVVGAVHLWGDVRSAVFKSCTRPHISELGLYL